MYLNQIITPDHVLDCKNVLCDAHNNSIQFLHDSIINALHKSASDVLKFTIKVRKRKLFLDGMIWIYLLNTCIRMVSYLAEFWLSTIWMFLICANCRGIITTNKLN